MKLSQILRGQRAAKQTELDAVLATPVAEKRSLTEDEKGRFDALRAEINGLDEQIASVSDSEARAEAAETESRAAADRQKSEEERASKAAEARVANGTGDQADPHITVGAEERVYGRGSGQSYFKDLILTSMPGSDPDAAARLQRHGKEIEVEARRNPNGTAARGLRSRMEGRALNTSTGTGGTFVPPEYLTEQFVAFAREARPFADAMNRQPLPKGTDVIYLPKVTAGTGVAVQGTQNTAVQETDLTDAYISAPVQTVAGQQTISLQLVEQSPVNFDEIVFSDLANAHAQELDALSLAAVLAVSGINSETYTDASPTLAKMWPFLGKGLADIRTNRHMPASHIWMTPDRWYWSVTQVDANNRPLVVPNTNGPVNAMGNAAEGLPLYDAAGKVIGAPAFLDSNIPSNLGAGTNQDVIIVARMDDLYLYESVPVARALPQTLGNTLSIILQYYSYTAILANRYPTSIATVGGTGLVTPTW